MLPVYIFCAVLGIPLLALLTLGGGDVDTGAGFDLDADFDVDAGVDLDAGGAIDGFGDLTAFFLRIPASSYAFFLAFFGGGGLLGTLFNVGATATIVLAVIAGVFGAAVNTALFSFLRNTESTSQLSDRHIEGRLATVSVPIDSGKRGRVWIDTGQERVQLTASSIESALDATFGRGEQVVIVEMADGVAKVMAVDPDLTD